MTPINQYEAYYQISENGDVYSLDRIVLGVDGVAYPMQEIYKTEKLRQQTMRARINGSH